MLLIGKDLMDGFDVIHLDKLNGNWEIDTRKYEYELPKMNEGNTNISIACIDGNQKEQESEMTDSSSIVALCAVCLQSGDDEKASPIDCCADVHRYTKHLEYIKAVNAELKKRLIDNEKEFEKEIEKRLSGDYKGRAEDWKDKTESKLIEVALEYFKERLWEIFNKAVCRPSKKKKNWTRQLDEYYSRLEKWLSCDEEKSEDNRITQQKVDDSLTYEDLLDSEEKGCHMCCCKESSRDKYTKRAKRELLKESYLQGIILATNGVSTNRVTDAFRCHSVLGQFLYARQINNYGGERETIMLHKDLKECKKPSDDGKGGCVHGNFHNEVIQVSNLCRDQTYETRRFLYEAASYALSSGAQTTWLDGYLRFDRNLMSDKDKINMLMSMWKHVREKAIDNAKDTALEAVKSKVGAHRRCCGAGILVLLVLLVLITAFTAVFFEVV